MFRLKVVILTLSVTCDLFAQRALYPDARILSLADITVVTSEKATTADNPASLGSCDETSLSFSYYNRYMIPELSTQAVSSVISLGKGAICPSLSYYGSRLYNESSAAFAYGRRLGKVLSGGIRFGFVKTHVEALWQTNWLPVGEFGFTLAPANHFLVGLQTINPWEIWAGNNREYSPGETNAGIEYSLPENFSVMCQLSRANTGNFNFSFGTEYFLVKTLALRLGVRFPTVTSYTFGIGYWGSRLSVDLGFEQHPLLGLSSVLSVNINLKHHEK